MDAKKYGSCLPAFLRRLTWLSIPGAVVLILLFLIQPDSLAFLTVIPAECWLAGGIALQLLSCRSFRTWPWLLSAMIWTGFAVMFVEPLVSLPRSFISAVAFDDQQLRVVSLNCHMGQKSVLQDLQSQRPDLVLLQESPERETVERWAKELYGEDGAVLWGRDCSILARGKLFRHEIPYEAAFVAATWTTPGGKKLDVISLRLWPQPFRLDFWNPECWTSFRDVRKIQREQMHDVREQINRSEFPVIVGGDFNCPAGDAAEWVVHAAGMRDAFRAAGRGWSKTITNEIPFHRIDRIWLSQKLVPGNLVALRTKGSDHRLIRCDFHSSE